jgi:hypothetical protein
MRAAKGKEEPVNIADILNKRRTPATPLIARSVVSDNAISV